MPYKTYRRRGFRKVNKYSYRNYKKSGYPSSYCRPKAKDYAMAAWTGLNYIKGLVNSEMLHHNQNASISISNTGTVVHLTNITQGDGSAQRTGNSILLRTVFGRISACIHASATDTFIRCILFKDKQQVGDTLPLVTQVLRTNSYLAALNSNQAGRFIILKDFMLKLNSANNTNSFRKILRKLHQHVRYNGTANTDIQKSGVYILFISNEATNTPTLDYDLRVSYHDN